MNQKTATQLVIFIGAFFLLWFALSRINYTGTEKYKELSEQKEKLLGDLLIKQILNTNNEIENDSVTTILNKIKKLICIRNNIDTSSINLYLIKNHEVNAYAFPGNNMVVHSGLILFCESPEELAAVIAHEIAHIEKNHVMQKLTKEIGISLLSAIIGNNNNEIVGEITRMISSNYYSRDLESEADEVAVKYLANAGVNPSVLANFLFRFTQNYPDLPKELEWVSSHPIAKERAAEILSQSESISFEEIPILDDNLWQYLHQALTD
jgi:beta-barrel assembly-enhancing protease